MNSDYVRKKISSLLTANGVSEYKLSLHLGHSKGYVQGITSGRANPPLSEISNICDYFGITLKDFFDEEAENPALVNQILDIIRNMDEEDLTAILGIVKRINAK